MGLISRNKSGNLFAGSRLNVPGQGIYNIKKSEGDKIGVKTSFSPRPSTTPTPTPSPTPTPTPTPIVGNCFFITQYDYDIITEYGSNIEVC